MPASKDQSLSDSLCELQDVIAAINELDLELLPRDWADEIWKEKFSQCPNALPDDYAEKFSILNSTESIEIMEQARQVIHKWLAKNASGYSWEGLGELDHKKLLALLFFYVKNATECSDDLDSIFLGIKAMDLYLDLLIIPGSKIFNIFHMPLYEACLAIFSLYKVLDDNTELTVPQAVALQQDLNDLLKSFKKFVRKFSLKNEDAMRKTLSNLAEVTRAERGLKIESSGHINDRKSCLLYTKTAYDVMKCLCDEAHGRPCETSRLAFLHIFPNLSLVGGSAVPEMDKWTVQEKTVVRANALWFIQTCVASLGQPVIPNIKILIQHLTRSMPTRADERPKFIDLVVTLISLLPETPYFETLLWIFREAFSNTISQRVVALELLAKLIYLKQGGMERSNVTQSSHANSETSGCLTVPDVQNNKDSDVSASNSRVISFSKPIEYLPIEYRRTMLAIIIDRIRDASATIGAKALSILSGLISNKSSPTVKKLINAVFLDPYKDDYEQPRQEHGFVDVKVFNAALSSGKLAESDTNLLPDGVAVVELLQKHYLVSGRHSTRRGAVQVVLQLFQLNPYWMSSPMLTAFSQHCRDPSKQLRKEMIKLLTELLLFYPTHSKILELWVHEVVPAVDDDEDTVAEEALRVLKTNIVEKITSTSTDALPWKLLSQIASHKMRTFLKVACQKWQRKNEINQSKINAIMSHIGSEFNPAVWILLSSLSEYVDFGNPQPVFDYYLNHIVDNKVGQVPNLVVITLHNSWTHLKTNEQDLLQQQLFADLKECKTLTTLVPMSVDIATAMMVHRADDKLQAKKEVAKWAKVTVSESEKHIGDCLGGGLADFDCDLCAYHMTLIGSLTELHPDEVSVNTFDLIFQFLTTTKVLPRSKLCKLKAVAVLTLARMAFLDNVIASRLILGLSPFLSNKTDPVLLNNVIVSIADIGERFPNLIEPLVPYLSLCLKNSYRNIRELTLVVIIDLLKEDYLRARSVIVYHLLSLLNDRSERTVAIVKSYFAKAADKKKLNVDEILIRCMFQYNKYKTHSLYRIEALSKDEEILFALSGDDKLNNRITVYRYLLKIVSSVNRIEYCQHICQVVLNGIADGLIRIDIPEGQGLLKDTFGILLSPEMQFDEVSKNKEDREEENENEDVRATIIVALFETKMLPLVVSLCSKVKKVLSKHRNLSVLLYAFLRELLRDYKNDLMSLFPDDRQFGEEIAHEIKTKPRDLNPVLDSPREEGPSKPNPQAVVAEVRQELESASQHKRKSTENANATVSKKAKSNDDVMNELSREVSQVRLKKTQERKSSRRSQRSASVQDNVATEGRRTTRSSSLNAGEIDSGQVEMPPPSTLPTRMSRRRPATPSAVPSASPLFSSTPLLASHAEIEGVDISPVVQENERTTV